VGVPDDRQAVGKVREDGAQAGLRAHAAAVVGDQDRVGGAQGVAGGGRDRADNARRVAAVYAQEGPALGADAHLLRRGAVEAEVQDRDPRPVEQGGQLPPGSVLGQRGDQGDPVAITGGEGGGEPGPAGPGEVHLLVHDRHRGVRAQPLDSPLHVAVEQGVADDDEVGAAHRIAPSGGRDAERGTGRRPRATLGLLRAEGGGGADLAVERRAEEVDEDEVRLLDGRRRRGVHARGVVADPRQGVRAASGQRPGGHPALAGRLRGGEDVGALTGG
jgi:hypothetical protein